MTDADLEAHESSGNIFADLELPNAEEMLLKSQLTAELRRQISARNLTQTAAAKLLSVGQADLSKLLRGSLRGYSVERLLRMLTAFDQDIEITVRPRAKTAGRGRITFSSASA